MAYAPWLYGNYVQSTVAPVIGSGDLSFVLASSAGFAVPSTPFLGIVRVDDTGNSNWTPQAGPFELIYYTTNTLGTNTLSGLLRGQDGTTPHAFSAGATVYQTIGAGSLKSMVPIKFYSNGGGGSATSYTIANIPPGYSNILIEIAATNSTGAAHPIYLQFNGDAGADYFGSDLDAAGTGTGVLTPQETIGGTVMTVGSTGAGSVNLSATRIRVIGYAQATRIPLIYQSWRTDSGATGTLHSQYGGGVWTGSGPVTSVNIGSAAGTFTNALITAYLEP